LRSSLFKTMIFFFAVVAMIPGVTAEAVEQKDQQTLKIDGTIVMEWRYSPSWVDRVQPTSDLVSTNKIIEKSNLATAAIINFKAPLNKGLTAFARIGAQATGDPRIASFEVAHRLAGRAIPKKTAEFDQFGVIATTGTVTAKVGRQDLSIGSTGLLYNTTINVGDTSVDALKLSSDNGKFTWEAVLAKEREDLAKDNVLNILSLYYKMSKQLTVGVIGATQEVHSSGMTNHYQAANFKYRATPKLMIHGEFITSDDRSNFHPLMPRLSEDPTGKSLVADYSFNKRTSVMLCWWDMKYGADISNRSIATIASEGWSAFLKRWLDKTSLLELNYGRKVYNAFDKPVEYGTRILYYYFF
jgi:hypothetical protein